MPCLFIIGLVAGILSTAVMTITEMSSWKRWGIHGVFEWHENYIIIKRLRQFLHFSNTVDIGVESHFKGIFFLHFLNGALAGIAFHTLHHSYHHLSLLLIYHIVYLAYFMGFSYGSLLLCLYTSPSQDFPPGIILLVICLR
jgi:hypothetical protein